MICELATTLPAEETVHRILRTSVHMVLMLLASIDVEATIRVKSVLKLFATVATRECIGRVLPTCTCVLVKLLQAVYQQIALAVEGISKLFMAEFACECVHGIPVTNQPVQFHCCSAIENTHCTSILVCHGQAAMLAFACVAFFMLASHLVLLMKCTCITNQASIKRESALKGHATKLAGRTVVRILLADALMFVQ
jgi:hypothetical protein